MRKKDRIALAHTLAACLEKHDDPKTREGIIEVKYAINDMLYIQQGHEAWSQFEKAWGDRVRNPTTAAAPIKKNGATKHDERHGGPFDRGGADFWYRRGYEPHYYVGGSYTSDRVEKDQMTAEEIAAYRAGYELAEADGEQKDYG